MKYAKRKAPLYRPIGDSRGSFKFDMLQSRHAHKPHLDESGGRTEPNLCRTAKLINELLFHECGTRRWVV